MTFSSSRELLAGCYRIFHQLECSAPTDDLAALHQGGVFLLLSPSSPQLSELGSQGGSPVLHTFVIALTWSSPGLWHQLSDHSAPRCTLWAWGLLQQKQNPPLPDI